MGTVVLEAQLALGRIRDAASGLSSTLDWVARHSGELGWEEIRNYPIDMVSRILCGDLPLGSMPKSWLLKPLVWAFERLCSRHADATTAKGLLECALARHPKLGMLHETLIYVIDKGPYILSHMNGAGTCDSGEPANGVEAAAKILSNYAKNACHAHDERQSPMRRHGYGFQDELAEAGSAIPATASTGLKDIPPEDTLSCASPTERRRALAIVLLVLLVRIALILFRADGAQDLPEVLGWAVSDARWCMARMRAMRSA